MNSRLKLLTLSSPFLYQIAHKFDFVGGVACTGTTRLCIEGYPSSANSYSLNLARLVLPAEFIASHSHAVANMKLARAENISTIFISRKPEDAISSHLARHGHQVDYACGLYLQLYEYVLNNASFLQIVEFEEVVGDPLFFIQKICGLMKVEYSETRFQHADAAVKKHLAEYEETQLGTKNFAGLLPNADKEAEKRYVQQSLDSYKVFGLCSAVYQSLSQLASQGGSRDSAHLSPD